jgi:hypothetical protein
MSYGVSTSCTKKFCIGSCGKVPVMVRSGPTTGNCLDQDRTFIALLDAYRPHGGFSRVNDLPFRGLARFDGRDTPVDDLVYGGKLFGLSWHGSLWIPMFQFELLGLIVAAGPQRVVANLGAGFDGWELASWFVEPHSWLSENTPDGRSISPIQCLCSRLPDVLNAARAYHFAEMG